MLTIYLSHPISGVPLDQVFAYYDELMPELRDAGYRVLHPLIGKDFLRGNPRPGERLGYPHPICGPHALARRDQWMIKQADVVYADLSQATVPSIGCCFELAWAALYRKHVVVALQPNGPHHHSFIMEAADVLFPVPSQAVDYLKTLAATGSPPLKIYNLSETIP